MNWPWVLAFHGMGGGTAEAGDGAGMAAGAGAAWMCADEPARDAKRSSARTVVEAPIVHRNSRHGPYTWRLDPLLSARTLFAASGRRYNQ